jgi:hypothetical protein
MRILKLVLILSLFLPLAARANEAKRLADEFVEEYIEAENSINKIENLSNWELREDTRAMHELLEKRWKSALSRAEAKLSEAVAMGEKLASEAALSQGAATDGASAAVSMMMGKFNGRRAKRAFLNEFSNWVRGSIRGVPFSFKSNPEKQIREFRAALKKWETYGDLVPKPMKALPPASDAPIELSAREIEKNLDVELKKIRSSGFYGRNWLDEHVQELTALTKEAATIQQDLPAADLEGDAYRGGGEAYAVRRAELMQRYRALLDRAKLRTAELLAYLDSGHGYEEMLNRAAKSVNEEIPGLLDSTDGNVRKQLRAAYVRFSQGRVYPERSVALTIASTSKALACTPKELENAMSEAVKRWVRW